MGSGAAGTERGKDETTGSWARQGGGFTAPEDTVAASPAPPPFPQRQETEGRPWRGPESESVKPIKNPLTLAAVKLYRDFSAHDMNNNHGPCSVVAKATHSGGPGRPGRRPKEHLRVQAGRPSVPALPPEAAGSGPQQPPAAGTGLLGPPPERLFPRAALGWVQDDLTPSWLCSIPAVCGRLLSPSLLGAGVPLVAEAGRGPGTRLSSRSSHADLREPS